MQGRQQPLKPRRRFRAARRGARGGTCYLGALSALFLLLTACGTRAPAPTGALQLDIFGLPAGQPASVQVAGPGDFSRTLTQSQTLTDLTPGTYTVSAESVAGYVPEVVTSPVQVRANATAQVSVTYRSGPGPGPGPGGDISGTVSVVGAVPVGLGTSVTAPFVPGEVIVKFREAPASVAALGTLQAAGRSLASVRPVGGAGAQLYRVAAADLGAASTAREATLAAVSALRAREDVLYAHPNYLLEAFAEPNDPLYESQWHYRAINLPEAWSITTGGPVTVAVLDTGVATGHPDLTSKLLPGYSFVTVEGRGSDATDPGGGSSYHGTHVAGTVAAATDNGIGVAGVSWGARLLPVRVLGQSGGNLADAIDGIYWSVGLPVPGVPDNPNPARVLNLSLGGPFLCSEVPALQEAFDRAVDAGATVVVAAGNDNTDASGVTPASCGNVITVGATDARGVRAGYSNFGPRIDLMAPGGDLNRDDNGDGNPDGVLSTLRDPSSGEDTYGYLDGTSMAAPHVAGLVALMKTLRPSLTGPQVRDVLVRTATPIVGGGCGVGCGAGLIDAAAALEALQAPAAPNFALTLSPAAVALTAGESAQVEVRISRANFDGEVTLNVQGAPSGLSASFSPQSTAGSSSTLTLSAAAELSGSFELTVQGVGGGLLRTTTLSVFVERPDTPPVTPPPLDVRGTYVFACPVAVVETDTCDVAALPSVQIDESGASASYTIPNVPPGSYYVFAWNDLNGNGQLDVGEPIGVHLQGEQAVTVVPPVTGVDITMVPAVGTQVGGVGVRHGPADPR
jgi:serine protease